MTRHAEAQAASSRIARGRRERSAEPAGVALKAELEAWRTRPLDQLGTSFEPTPIEPTVVTFRQGLRDLGWVEGQTVALETAKNLGLMIPPSVLARADQIIE